ncbi:hypothetical protein GQX73_g3682 [Xylaria multiplex]|uniref:Uncharacterized protein n=1 Tax=Xylaria multiplex TaxID=323545 RepID=A0A7C8ITZ4_9PEZI|nr:hypothetical protein GQX73_g3682 [Xylaria multiplex]
MLASLSGPMQTWCQRRLGRLLFTLLITSLSYSPYVYALPVYATKQSHHKETSTLSPEKKPVNFPREFATAMGVAVTVVIIGTTLICVFAHCWRQILDWSRGDEGVTRKKLHKDKEAWFCGTDRGLPMPQFDILEPETEPLSPYAQVRELGIYPSSCYGYEHPAVYARHIVPGSGPGPGAHWNNSVATLPGWIASEEIERPASVAYFLDRP